MTGKEKVCEVCKHEEGWHQQIYGKVPRSDEYPMGTKIIGYTNCTKEADNEKMSGEYGYCNCPLFKPKHNYVKLPDSDFSLVEFSRSTPHCKNHGAMNKMTADGIWRCVSTYREYWVDGNRKFDENNCQAGCQEQLSNSEVKE